MSATTAVREELAALPDDDVAAELGTALRVAAALTRGADGTGTTLATPSGAVARRVRRQLDRAGGRTEVAHREGPGIAPRWRVALVPPAAALLHQLGVLCDGRPVPGLPEPARRAPAAAVRGALLVAGSVSAPGQAPHLELRIPTLAVGEQLVLLLAELDIGGARLVPAGGGGRADRVVVKSRRQLTALLHLTGAAAAAARVERGRQVAVLRGGATRLANADHANLRRSVAAAGRQVEEVERALGLLGTEALGEDVAATALARLANPTATLGELAQLLGVGRATVHRRLARLTALADERSGGADAPPTG